MSARAKAVDDLEQTLGYRFRDRDLLERALTHASVGEGAKKIRDNECLEFLGDRVLGLLVSETLMRRFPEAKEGELSQRFHALVNREACASAARKLGLGPALRMAAGETKSGGRENNTILGDAIEALIAAVYLDSSFDQVKTTFGPVWAQILAETGDGRLLNPKSFLQEWAAARAKPVPLYEILARSGPDHAPVFSVSVTVDGLNPASGTGRSRQDAEKSAAVALLKRENLI
ncbi:MAG: ribonuclease III [Asticcacaulis sp.]